ncbi:MAG: TAXI family TRAP transporter solute-binding subunit [Deltaproteobacteria bacterium]|nr:TAXI family TRAP transporter solute-binding subunit [Deltaproteobacteria bacterium]
MEKKKFRKCIYLIPILLMAFSLALPFAWKSEAAAAPEKIRLSMGGASTGTWIYMFCALLSETWKKYIPDLDITVLATPGTTANYIPMDKGELDLAGASTSGDFYAMNGMYFTKDKLSNFCSILPATKGFNQAFTYVDSPIKAWKDLEGKRLCVGARGSPTSIIQEEICKVLGIKPKFIFSTPSEAIEMVKDRRVDAMIYGVGAPWGGLMDIAAVQKVRFLPMTPEEQKKVHAAYPYQVPDVIPAKTYAFQTEDIPTTMGFQTVNARPGLTDDLVYKLIKVIWAHWDEVVKAAPAAKWVKPQDMVNMVAPIHPGAVKYYREIGVAIPDHLVWKKK